MDDARNINEKGVEVTWNLVNEYIIKIFLVVQFPSLAKQNSRISLKIKWILQKSWKTIFKKTEFQHLIL